MEPTDFLFPILDDTGRTIATLPPVRTEGTSANFGAGRQGDRLHAGLDIVGNIGDPVIAIQDGVIHNVYYSNSYGNVVEIEYPDGTVHRLAHLSEVTPNIEPGTIVVAGQQVGAVGNSGNAEDPHLHYEVILPHPGWSGHRPRADS